MPAAIAVRLSRCSVRGGTGPGVVTLAWLRAAGRAGFGAARVPRRESPGALLVLTVTGLRARRRRARVLACRIRTIMSNHGPLTCNGPPVSNAILLAFRMIMSNQVR